MYIISLDLQLLLCVTIYNQCSNTKLASPVYFGNGISFPTPPNQQIDTNTKMRVYFEINATQDNFEGALLFKLQRYVGFNDQHNIDTLTTETNKNDTKCVQLLVAWKVKDSKPFLYVVLIEHAKEFIWDKNKLKSLYDKNHSRLKEYDDVIPDTWFIDDNIALKTSFKARSLKKVFELNISISEEERDDYAIRPLCVDLTR
jgi:hypothetical protein